MKFKTRKQLEKILENDSIGRELKIKCLDCGKDKCKCKYEKRRNFQKDSYK